MSSILLLAGLAPDEAEASTPSVSSEAAAPDDEAPASEGEEGPAPAPEGEQAPEFGELEAAPEPSDPLDSASGGYGAVAPLPTYTEALEPSERAGPPEVEPVPEPAKPPSVGFEEPEDFGPFFEGEPVSEVTFPGDAYRPDRNKPFASVAGGRFCFVEDGTCHAALITDADVGVGINIITSDRGFDVPYTQVRVRGGLVLRPLMLAKRQQWHPWGIGVVGSWSLASSSITATNRDPEDPNVGVTETQAIRTYRVALHNQLWLSSKRNALHIDFSLGGANSSVLDFPGRYWGTSAEVGVGFGGWGGLYFAGDFFDGDTRVMAGLRGHGIAMAPAIALVLLGLVAGGASL